MRIFDPSVLIFSRDGAHVQWGIEPEDDDLELLDLEVQRSESPRGPWQTLQTVDPLTTFSFFDKTVRFRPQNQFIFFRVVATVKTTGDVFYESPAFTTLESLPLDAIEIIRQHRILLEGVNGHPPLRGRPCTVYKKRNFGPKCRQCRDAITGRITVSNCKACSGTGVVEGYYDSIDVNMNIGPYPVQLQLTSTNKQEDSGTTAFLTNYPLMYPGDIIVEKSEKHWRVVSIDPTERQRTLVHQVCRLTQLKPDDIAHETLLHSSNR